MSYKEQTISIMEKVTRKLNEQIHSLKNPAPQQNTIPSRTFEQFKARIIDLPYTETLNPLFDQFSEFEQIITTKIATEFPQTLIQLQKEILSLYFNESQFKGIKIIQRHGIPLPSTETTLTTYEYGQQVPGIPDQLLLQIDLDRTTMSHEKILQFYHNGMIDLLQFKWKESYSNLFEKFGEKFLLTVANIGLLRSDTEIACKIFATYPKMTSQSYRPAQKRVIIFEENLTYVKSWHASEPDEFSHIDSTEKVDILQRYEHLPTWCNWKQYKLLAEGHYIQIWAKNHWHMLLPFSGEGAYLQEEDNIYSEKVDMIKDDLLNYTSDEDTTIPDTHMDF